MCRIDHAAVVGTPDDVHACHGSAAVVANDDDEGLIETPAGRAALGIAGDDSQLATSRCREARVTTREHASGKAKRDDDRDEDAAERAAA